MHFIGIGGSGMNALARLVMARGVKVSGSDREESRVTRALREAGARITIGHDASAVGENTVTVVASAAIPKDNPELALARERGVEVLKYAGMLGRLMAEKRGVCIAGTHGKTTSTAMAAHALMKLGADPSVVVGGDVAALGGPGRAGEGEFFVAEACEYDRSFLNLAPDVAMITNVEPDHLDYYSGGISEIVGAFADFVKLVPEKGALAVCTDSPHAVESVRAAGCRVVTYGENERAQFRLIDSRNDKGSFIFDAAVGEREHSFYMLVPGRHNALNALGVAAMLTGAGFDAKDVLDTLADFAGAGRRFEFVSGAGGIEIYDDYAHHPTELAALFQAARDAFAGRRIIAVFQPHQYSRTRIFIREFAGVLTRPDAVIIPPIFSARDSGSEGEVSSEVLAEEAVKAGADAAAVESLEAAAERVLEIAGPGDVVLTIGAGDVYKVAHALRDRLEAEGGLK